MSKANVSRIFLTLDTDTPMAETPKPDAAKPTHYGPDSRFKGKAGRSGPPKGNRNGIRHGLRAGKLPLDCAHIEQQINALRRQLEDAVMDARKQVTLTDAACILTATKWERHSCLPCGGCE